MTAEYFDRKELATHVATRIDPQVTVSLDLRSSGVTNPPGNNDDFSVRWSGYLTVPTTGVYDFQTVCQGACQASFTLSAGSGNLYASVLQGLVPGSPQTFSSGAVSLTAGQRLNMVSTGSFFGSPRFEIRWKPPGSGAFTPIPSSALAPAVVPQRPKDFILASTGSGRIALYGDRPVGSAGVNFYRGATANGEDRAAPINGASPVVAPSYAGSPYVLYTDTDLTNDADYFYQAKAAYANPVTGVATLSNPTEEDHETPDPDGVPWDTKSAPAIIAGLQSLTTYLFADHVSVMGPDGAIYDSYSGQRPPDYLWDTVAQVFRNRTNPADILPPTQMPYEGTGDEEEASIPPREPELLASIEEFADSPSPLSSESVVASATATDLESLTALQTVPVFVANSGPTRKFLSQRGYRGINGLVTTPSATYANPNSPYADTPYLYFGGTFGRRDDLNASVPNDPNVPDEDEEIRRRQVTSGGAEIDAGLGYMPSSGGGRRWKPITLHLESGRTQSWLHLPQGFSGYGSGTRIRMTYQVFGTPQQNPNIKNNVVRYNSLLGFTGSTGGQDDVTSVTFFQIRPTLAATRRAVGTVEMKRVSTIGQNDLTGTGLAQGYVNTGSYYEGATFQDVRLMGEGVSTGGTLWDRTRSGRLIGASWPLQTPGRVSATTIQQWHYETNVSCNLR